MADDVVTSGESKQNSRAASSSGVRSFASWSRAPSQVGPSVGSDRRAATDTELVEVTVNSLHGPSTANATTGSPKKSVSTVQLVGEASATSSLDTQCWRWVSRWRRWASFRLRVTGVLYL